MRCGNCKGNHATVDAVRECYNIRQEGGAVATKADPIWPPSEKQVDYVISLQLERNLPDGYIIRTRDELEKMDRAQVSDMIVMLRALSRKEGTQGGSYTMPAGRYAVQDDDGVWKFYEVNQPDKGKWKGYTFIKMLVGAPGSYRKVDMQKSHRDRILNIIEPNAKQAQIDYGLQSGVCGRCSSPLSDAVSLSVGMGPICRAKSGWFE